MPRRPEKVVKIAKQEILKTSKSARQSADVKALTIPKKTISLKVTKAPEKKKNTDCVSYNQESRLKKHSRYQSGDTGQNKSGVNHCLNPNPFIFGCYNTCCAYCQLDTNKIDKKRGFKKIKSASTTTNTNKNKGTLKVKNILLSKTESMKCNDGNIEHDQIMKNYGNERKSELTTDVKDKHNFRKNKGMKSAVGNIHSRENLSSSVSPYLRCLRSVKGEKTRLSYGDVPPFQKEGNIRKARNKLFTEYVYFMQKPKYEMDDKLRNFCCPCPKKEKNKFRSGDVPLNKTEGSDDDPTKMTKKGKNKTKFRSGDVPLNKTEGSDDDPTKMTKKGKNKTKFRSGDVPLNKTEGSDDAPNTKTKKAKNKTKFQDGDGPPTQNQNEEKNKPINKKKEKKESNNDDNIEQTKTKNLSKSKSQGLNKNNGLTCSACGPCKSLLKKYKTMSPGDYSARDGVKGKNGKRKTVSFDPDGEKIGGKGGKNGKGKVGKGEEEEGTTGKGNKPGDFSAGKKGKGKVVKGEEEKGTTGKGKKTGDAGTSGGKGKDEKGKTSTDKKTGAGDGPNRNKKSENLKSKIVCTCKKIKYKAQKPKGGKFIGAKITVQAKGDPSRKHQEKKGTKKLTKAEKKADKYKACVCGSSICDQEKEKITRSKKSGFGPKLPPCVCGSKPCAQEVKDNRKIAKSSKKLICRCTQEMKRRERKGQDEKKRLEDIKKLQRQFEEEDRERISRRKADHRSRDRYLKKSKKDGDVSLMLSSLSDILRLGWTASSDMLRQAKRTIFHPRHAAHRMNTLAHNPSEAASHMAAALKNVGAVTTMGRVRKRCTYMKNYQWVKSKLIENSMFRFAVNMWERNPKKRLKKPKKLKRRREPIDFECSLFMASLRRRPCLVVYYACPFFYPHCLSMLNLWKQFTDMILVLLAVVVWCPCILMMEVCRAFVCCFFCTG